MSRMASGSPPMDARLLSAEKVSANPKLDRSRNYRNHGNLADANRQMGGHMDYLKRKGKA